MNFVETLKWRGLIQDITPGLEEKLNGMGLTCYAGFDPTAPSLTLGNYLQVLTMLRLRWAGHKPIAVLGGMTAMIGDPSGKDAERKMLSDDEIDKNLMGMGVQLVKMFDLSGIQVIDNSIFYSGMSISKFLRNVGKHFTVNYMTSKESVKRRVETGMSYTEFSYQLFQAYDFLHLYNREKCALQIGGSDQWGNIISGIDLIKKTHPDAEVFGMTTPLLLKSDGTKFGKSEEGNIWLDPKLTSPYKFYQFWLNIDDADVIRLNRMFSIILTELIEELEATATVQVIKKSLAQEMLQRIHGNDVASSVMKVSEMLFNPAYRDHLDKLTEDELELISKEIPSFTVPRELLENKLSTTDLFTTIPIFATKSDIRRAIKAQALMVNKDVVEADELIDRDKLLHGRYMLVENGKKNKNLINFY